MTRILAAFLLLTFVASCGGGPPPPRDKFYRLDVPAPTVILDKPLVDGALEVSRMQSDGVTIERAIAFSRDKTQLTQYAYHYWVDTPVLMLRDVLVDQLRAAKVAPLVVTPEHRTLADHAVLGQVRRFEHVQNGSGALAVVELELTLVDTRNGKVRLLRTYSVEEPAADATVEAAAQAMSRAVHVLCGQFLADLSKLSP